MMIIKCGCGSLFTLPHELTLGNHTHGIQCPCCSQSVTFTGTGISQEEARKEMEKVGMQLFLVPDDTKITISSSF